MYCYIIKFYLLFIYIYNSIKYLERLQNILFIIYLFIYIIQ